MSENHDQSRPVPRASAVEALTQIRALCDERMDAAFGMSASFLAADVRAVLDAVPVDATPPQGVVLSPEEKQLIAWALNHAAEEWNLNGNEAEADKRWDLAERFEASA